MKKESNTHLAELRKRVAQAPTDPGVYRWKDAEGTILYVGKAKNLRNRLKSYTNEGSDEAKSPWKRALIDRIADVEMTVTSTELEALVLETNLIKEIRPKYNVMMKDDKNYVYVRITVKDPYPRISVVRRLEEDDAKYFGPYLSSYETKKILDALNLLFPFRACKESLDRLNKQNPQPATCNLHPCLEYQIGKCCGLCINVISQEEYREHVDEVMDFFRGNQKHVLQQLQWNMNEAAQAKQFERAAELRDTLQFIVSLGEEQFVSDTSFANTDSIGIAIRGDRAQVVLLRERGGKLIGELSFSLRGETETPGELLSGFLTQYYSDTQDIPDLIVCGEELEEKVLIEEWLREKRGNPSTGSGRRRVEIRIPERGKKSRQLQMAEKNANEKIIQQFAKWEAEAQSTEQALKDLQEILGLPAIPKRIEGYDISHLGGMETVGSMVVMLNGKPANAQYRSFTIRTLKEGTVDDYKALQEVLRRRLRHLQGNLKDELAKRKENGIEFRRARKNDLPAFAEHLKKENQQADEAMDPKTILLAMEESEIIGCVRLKPQEKQSHLITSLWVDPSHRGGRLGQTLLRAILAPLKKGKAYIQCREELHDYYATLGFRHVIEPPAFITNPNALVMVYDAIQNKADTSLTAHPDLLVIDGGKGQLNAVIEVLRALKIEIPVIGLAKREEEVFLPGESFPTEFPKDAQAKFLLMRLRDEAHRFANRHREKRLTKKLLG